MVHDPFASEDDFEKELESNVSLDPDDRKRVSGDSIDDFKAEDKTHYRIAVVYFNTFDLAFVGKAKLKAQKEGRVLTKEEILELRKKAQETVATKLGKSWDQLSDVDKLDTREALFKKYDHQFHEKVGSVVSLLGKGGPDADRIWKQLGEVKTKFVTFILKYPCNRDGEVDKELFVKGSWMLMRFRFPKQTYEKIFQANRGLEEAGTSLAHRDINLFCTNSKYQNFDVSAAGGSLWRTNKDIERKILEKAVSLYGKINPYREVTTDDVRKRLEGDGGGGSSGGGGGGGSGGGGKKEEINTDDLDRLMDSV